MKATGYFHCPAELRAEKRGPGTSVLSWVITRFISTWWWLSKHPLEICILTQPMYNKYKFEWRTVVLCLAKPRDGDKPKIYEQKHVVTHSQPIFRQRHIFTVHSNVSA